MRCIGIPHFSDRRFWHGGYDKAEYDLLTVLARNVGRVLTHRQLLTAVWGPGHAEDVQYLRVYVGHPRQKLGPTGAGLIATEAGVGYRRADAEA